MGNRANIVVKQSGGGEIWLYAHWSGETFAHRLRDALAKKWRWKDDAYLTRIIFDALVGDHHGSETGFGITTRLADNNNPILVVDVDAQRVGIAPENRDGPGYDKPLLSFTFEEYAALTDEECDAALAKVDR